MDSEKLALRSELTLNSHRYPVSLKQLPDPPERLYALGNVEVLKVPAIAIVGARKATPYGLECAHHFAFRAARRGLTVVSGGAIGCDMAAHQGALEGGGGTIVVLGGGADVVYPLRARTLLNEILEAGGLLLSEAPWGSAPHGFAFSKRNRIIAALARGTLIVEAGLPSGTFQTADHTLALGNEVMVVPGSVFSKESRGSNRLLAQGAVPIVDDDSFDDALVALYSGSAIQRQAAAAEGAMEDEVVAEETESVVLDAAGEQHAFETALLRNLAAQPMTADALAVAHGREVMTVIRTLSRLEIDGTVCRLRDGRFLTKPGFKLPELRESCAAQEREEKP